MLAPKRLKWRKPHKGRLKGISKAGNEIAFGEIGLKAITGGRITARQLEAARIAITRHVKRGAKLWIRIFPDKPRTRKPAETRMGKGKGNVEWYEAIVKPGKIIFEMAGLSEEQMRRALELASHKLPIKTKIIRRDELFW